MSEVIDCFKFMAENVPTWIKSLESLEQKVKDRQNEIARVPVPAHKLKRTGSNESIRPTAESADAIMEITSAPDAGAVDQAPNNQQQLLAKRKRKPTSLLSNGPVRNKYRTWNKRVVYYDSEIQACFETLVRNISSGRNLIRKTRLASAINPPVGRFKGDFTPSIAMIRAAREPGPHRRPDVGGSQYPTEDFRVMDAALDKAQNLCEQGAHQFLRDGACQAETSGAKSNFEVVIEVSELQLKHHKEVEEKRHREKEEIDSNKAVIESTEILGEGSMIEVDDGDADEFDVSTLDFQRTRLMART